MGTVGKMQDTAFYSMAESIRRKNLQTTKMKPTEMPDKIKGLIWYGDIVEYNELSVKDPGVLYIIEEEKERYIQPLSTNNDDPGGFIPILTDVSSKQLTYGDTFIFDFTAPSSFSQSSTCYVFIGGSCLNDHGAYAYDRYWGIHVGYRTYSTDTITLGIQAQSGNNGGTYSHYINKTFTPGQRQTLDFMMENPQYEYDPPQGGLRNTEPRTSGGFFLFGYREFDTGNPLNGDEFTRCASEARGGKFYRITIKDSSNNLKYDFKPRIQDGHIGMIDLVSNTFYPCNDDTKFRIGKDE